MPINLLFQLRDGIWWLFHKPFFPVQASDVVLQERMLNVRDHQGLGRTQL